jgi:hypothetical protein
MFVVRALRVLVPALIVLAVVAVVVSVLSARPDLQHAKRNVDRAWPSLSATLDAHYTALGQTNQKLLTLTGPVRELAGSVDDAMKRWTTATASGDVASQVRAANTLEGLSRRLVTTAESSQRVKKDQAAVLAVAAFALNAASTSNGPAVDAFNRAVTSYEKERRGPVRGIVARALGDGDIPVFTPAPPPNPT